MERKDEVGDIARAIQRLVESMRDIITNITTTTQSLQKFSEEFSSSFDHIAESINNVNIAGWMRLPMDHPVRQQRR